MRISKVLTYTGAEPTIVSQENAGQILEIMKAQLEIIGRLGQATAIFPEGTRIREVNIDESIKD